VRAICFDLFTLFDPRGVARAAELVIPGRGLELWNVWKTRQFEYSWLRASAGRYQDFEAVTEQALLYAADELKLTLSPPAVRRLVSSYSELEPWPDTRAALAAWRSAGLKLAPLANFSPAMMAHLLGHSALRASFDLVISTDRARTYKPDPRAYGLAPTLLGFPREQIAFAAFGGWDAAGAKWFGFRTFWLNRFGVAPEHLIVPDGTGTDLAALAKWLDGSS
jgi:2-haloacid dehalogenase